MIDPNDVTKFDRTPDELLEFWLFCLFVRGKNADVQAQKLDQFRHRMGGMPLIRSAPDDSIDFHLRAVGAGQYNTLLPAISQTLAKLKADPDFLKTASAVELESLRGVGPKTSRFFILHTRPKARVAVLDTHILNYLSERSGSDIPRVTPTGPRYAELEEHFLLYADFYGVDPAAFDLAIWRASRESHPLNWRDYYGGAA